MSGSKMAKQNPASRSQFRNLYKKLGITKEIEYAVIMHLADIGALDYCGTADGCTGDCPSGQSCVRTLEGNCVCGADSKLRSSRPSIRQAR